MPPDEARVQEALRLLQSGSFPNTKAAALACGLSVSTLRRRALGGRTLALAHQHEQLLTVDQEQWMVEWILRQDRAGFAPTHRQCKAIAQAIVNQGSKPQDPDDASNNTQPPPLGKNWLQGFIRRHRGIKDLLKARVNEGKRDRRSEISKYFAQLQGDITEFSIKAENIWTMNEVVLDVHTVASSDSDIPVSPETREWVTVIEAISATGRVIDPTLIFQGGDKVMPARLPNLPPQSWYCSATRSGWIVDRPGYVWLRDSFIPNTAPADPTDWRLLILDGHCETAAFSHLAHSHKVKILIFPPPCSHLVQPLDLANFAPLKKQYRRYVMEHINKSNRSLAITKSRFLTFFTEARESAFTSGNARAAFTAAGIHPFDPQKILNQQQFRSPSPEPDDMIIQRPSTPRDSSMIDPAIICTPVSARHFEAMAEHHLGQSDELIRKCVKALAVKEAEKAELERICASNVLLIQNLRSRLREQEIAEQYERPLDDSLFMPTGIDPSI